MGPLGATIRGLENAFDFKGRSSRSEYWWFLAVQVLLMTAAGYFDAVRIMRGAGIEAALLGASTFLGLFLIIPNISVSVRRLHDTGKSGANYLIFLVPVLGPPAFLSMMMLPSDPGENAYGLPGVMADQVGRGDNRPSRAGTATGPFIASRVPKVGRR